MIIFTSALRCYVKQWNAHQSNRWSNGKRSDETKKKSNHTSKRDCDLNQRCHHYGTLHLEKGGPFRYYRNNREQTMTYNWSRLIETKKLWKHWSSVRILKCFILGCVKINPGDPDFVLKVTCQDGQWFLKWSFQFCGRPDRRIDWVNFFFGYTSRY